MSSSTIFPPTTESQPSGMSVNVTANSVTVRNFLTNGTGNDTESDNDELSLASKVIYGIIIPIMIIVCIIGNILTMASYAQDRKLRTVHNTYLMSLATSDLLIGCVSMPFYAVYTLTSYRWPFGKAFCKIFMSVDFLACLESVFVIILVSYDRCMLLRQGAGYSTQQTMNMAKIRIAMSWVISFIVYVPAILFWDTIRGHSSIEEGDCDVEFYNEFEFIMVTSVIEFLIPLIVILVLNIYLYSLILKRSRKTPGLMAPISSKTEGTKSGQREGVISSSEAKNIIKYQARVKREGKAARSLAILVSVFTVCWMPYTVCTVIIAFCEECVSDDLYEAFNWLLWANSTLNPFLYAFTNMQFRGNFTRLLKLGNIGKSRVTKITPKRNLPAIESTVTLFN